MSKLKSPGIHLNAYDVEDDCGFGRATTDLEDALLREGVELTNASRNVVNFKQPQSYIFKDYTVGYTPWESTRVPDNWVENLKKVDELWTTASWLIPVFKQYVDEVFVLPHGIHESWVPIRHHWHSGPFTFVHTGEPALRKGGDILLEAWHKHFQYSNNVHLNIKCAGGSTARLRDRFGSNYASFDSYDNVTILRQSFSLAELWKLYALSHCMVYPSRGEGFGLIPLEAMCTGLPTILPTHHMGDYVDIGGIHLVNSKLVESPDQHQHTGKWLDHSLDELIFLMEEVVESYESIAERAYSEAYELIDAYSWQRVAQMFMERLGIEP